jgi:hypothetical protein
MEPMLHTRQLETGLVASQKRLGMHSNIGPDLFQGGNVSGRIPMVAPMGSLSKDENESPCLQLIKCSMDAAILQLCPGKFMHQ